MEKTSIIIVQKDGELSQMDVFQLSTENLYKKAGFKKGDGFVNQTTWSCNVNGTLMNVTVYAKTKGKANTENKYEFPPPADKTLFFGKCVLIAQDAKDSKFISLTKDLWNVIYESLFGGFEDLKSESEESDELDNIDDELKTTDGYLKDGFVVSDDEFLNYDSELEEEEYIE